MPRARVFTGWNLARSATRQRRPATTRSSTTPASTTPAPRRSLSRFTRTAAATIPARGAAQGMQDGIDLINALARASGDRRGGWRASSVTFFVSEVDAPDAGVRREHVAHVYLQAAPRSGRCSRRAADRRSSAIRRNCFARYSWPVEFVGPLDQGSRLDGFSVDDALTPLVNMGQQLFEPPDVDGWELGPGWFSTARCWRA